MMCPGPIRRWPIWLMSSVALLVAASALSAQDTVRPTSSVTPQPAGLAVAHGGSPDVVTFRYRLRDVAMQIAEEAFTVDSLTFPRGSFIVTGSAAELTAARALADSLGLT